LHIYPSGWPDEVSRYAGNCPKALYSVKQAGSMQETTVVSNPPSASGTLLWHSWTRFLIHVLINNLPDATLPPLQFSTPPQFETAEGFNSSKTQYFAGSKDLVSDIMDADTNFDWVNFSCLKHWLNQLLFHVYLSWQELEKGLSDSCFQAIQRIPCQLTRKPLVL
jgi:hypothetical protein